MYRALNSQLEALRHLLSEAKPKLKPKAKEPKGLHPDKVKEREAKAFAKGVAAANKQMHAHRKEVHKRVFGGKR